MNKRRYLLRTRRHESNVTFIKFADDRISSLVPDHVPSPESYEDYVAFDTMTARDYIRYWVRKRVNEDRLFEGRITNDP